LAQRTLLLFDVDGVLIHPVGYKMAMRALVDHFAARMGQSSMGPDDDEIAFFEACGFTNEWDSGAVCVSAILLAALDQQPDLRRGTLSNTFDAIRAARISVARPDFAGIIADIYQQHAEGHLPAARYLEMLAARLNDGALALARDLLGNVYDVIGTPTTRAFQTLTLGSARFAAVYGHPAPFENESLLTRHDVPLLDDTDRLLGWLRDAGHGAAIFTARPSLAPADLTQAPAAVLTGYAPEAEIAAELLGLAGKVPLIGQGRVTWLADRYGRGAADYIKPSPVQGLAAIGAAASGSEADALNAAAALYEHGELTGPLAALREDTTQVVVFEDSVGGIRATQHAVERLDQAGLDAHLMAVGVSPNVDKRAALAAVADHVVDDVNAGLALVYGT
jgi:beta-phosphoglucomutase-like phosphatase (HAD superfamily)